MAATMYRTDLGRVGGEVAGNTAKTVAGELAFLSALAQVGAADNGVRGVDPHSDVTQSARAVVEQGWQHPGRAIEALRTGPDSTGAVLGGVLELASDPRNYAGGIGALGQGLEASGKAPAIGGALKNAAFLAEVSNRLPLAPLAAIPRARRALLALPEYMQPAGKAAAQVTPTVASLLQSAVDHAGQALPDGVPTPTGLPPIADLAPVPPPRATLPDLPAPTPPPVQIPLRVETPRLPREEIATLLLTGGRPPTPLRPTPPLPFPMQRPVDVSARVADYLAGVRGRPAAVDLPPALRDDPLLAGLNRRTAELPTASNARTPDPLANASMPEAPMVAGRDTPALAADGTTDPTGLIELPMPATAERLPVTPDEVYAPGYPTTGIEQAATATASGGTPGAPGGGGIIPHTGGLPALNGQVAGTLGGAALGGGIGATQGNTDQARMENALLGAGTGALIGGNLGGSFPQLRQATLNAVHGAQGKLASSAFSPTVLDAAFDNGLDAMTQARGQQGASLADLPAALDNQWRSQVTATFRNWQQDAVNLALLVKEFGQDYGATGRDVDAMREQLGAHLRNPDKVARYGDLGARLQSVGLDRLIDPQKGLADLLGLGQISESLSHGTQLSAGQRMAAGAGIGWASSAAKISPLSPAFGAARGHLEPFIQGFFGTVNRLQHDAPRAAFLAKALDRDLPILADEFLSGLQTQGANVSALNTRGGYFTPQEVAQLAGTKAGQEWATVTEGITRLRSEKIAQLFGDFRDKGANATVADKAIGIAGRLFPFASWGLRYAPTLATIAARHPVATQGLVGYLATEAAQAKREGRPGYQVGTIPLTTETPVLGAGVRVSLGGASGERRLNPLALLTGPYGGELLSGPEELPDDATGYQRVKAAVKPLGLSPHPLVQAVMYSAGQDYQAPGSLSRTAQLEQLPQLLPGPLGMTIPSGRALLDAGRKILSGQGAPDSDPATRRYAEIVLKVTGRPLSDPRNGAYLEAIGNGNEPLWQAAKAQSVIGGALSGALSFGTGLPTSGSTTEAIAARQAPKLPYSSYQISQAPQKAQPVMLEANRRALANNPASGTYTDISGAGRKATLMDTWDREHAGLKRLTPGLFAERRKAYEESIGARR